MALVVACHKTWGAASSGFIKRLVKLKGERAVVPGFGHLHQIRASCNGRHIFNDLPLKVNNFSALRSAVPTPSTQSLLGVHGKQKGASRRQTVW